MNCKIPNCNDPVKYSGKQLCSKHYQQIYHHGKIVEKVPRLCSTEGCGKPHYMKTFCVNCFNKERRKGTVYLGKTCSVEGCDLPVFVLKPMLCERHHRQIKRKGIIYKSKQEPNDFVIYEDYIGIILLNENREVVGECLIDKEDYEKVKDYKWSLDKGKITDYVVSRTGRKPVNIAKIILGTESKIDHKNGKGLDNRKENLRFATDQQNAQNRGFRRDNVTGFKGITFSKFEKKYIAQIGINKKVIRLGAFVDPVEAAKTYDQAAVKYFGEFARTNQMEGRI